MTNQTVFFSIERQYDRDIIAVAGWEEDRRTMQRHAVPTKLRLSSILPGSLGIVVIVPLSSPRVSLRFIKTLVSAADVTRRAGEMMRDAKTFFDLRTNQPSEVSDAESISET